MTYTFNDSTKSGGEVASTKVVIQGRNIAEILKDVERKTLAWAMTETQGNQRQAAKLIGVSYNTFKAKIARHNLRATWS